MRRRSALLWLWLAGCGGEPSRAVPVPSFANTLPGHTVAVAWRSDGAALDFRWPALPPALPLRPATTRPDVVALLGDARAVAWPSLADSSLFRRALAAVPDGAVGVFVDLQQTVDMLPMALVDAADQRTALSRVMLQRAIGALRLRSLVSLAGTLRLPTTGASGFDLQLRATPVDGGLLALLASRTPARGGELPAGAPWTLAAQLVPEAAVGLVRELLAGDGDDAAALLRGLLRGPKLQAGLQAIAAWDGAVLAAGAADDWLWARLGVRDPRALGDALDDLAEPATDSWQFGVFKLQLNAGSLLVTRGAAPAERSTLTPALDAVLEWRAAAWGVSMNITPSEGAGLRLRGQLPAR